MSERDPVCGMELRPGQEEASITFHDRTYHFCSVECRKKFEHEPKRYMTSDSITAQTTS